MFLDEVDLDVSNEDPAHRRQHSVRAGLDSVKRTPGCQALNSPRESEQTQEKKLSTDWSPLGCQSSVGSQGAPRTNQCLLGSIQVHNLQLCYQ